MSLRKAAWIAAGAAVVALVVWAALRPTRVEVAEVRRGDLVATLSATGVVEAYQAEVAPAIIGRVSEVLVEEGDVVREGQVLARLEATKERAAVREREAAVAGARAEVEGRRAAGDYERGPRTP